MLFLRILLASGLLTLLVWVIRRAYMAARPRAVTAGEAAGVEAISAAELRAMERLAATSEELREALGIRPKIMEIAKDARILANADQLVREIAREVENRGRIAEALGEINDSRLSDQLTRADDRLREARDDGEARKLAEETIERLIAVRDARDKLKKRQEEIGMRAKNFALELRSAHLALLEATSSAGGSADRVDEVRARLKQAVDEAQRAAVAEDEVAKLIAHGREGSAIDKS